MKNFLFGALSAAIIFIIFGLVTEKNEPTEIPGSEWIISPRFYTLQDGITKEAAKEWFINEYLQLYWEFPGFNAMVGEPLRSSGWGPGTENNIAKEKGDFVVYYFFDTKKTKDYYFPPDGWSDAIVDGIAKHQATFDQLFGKYFVQEKYQNEEYLMFASSK